MIKKKICLLGTFGVGKTSLIRKYVQNIFSDEYITTIGVKIEKKPSYWTATKKYCLSSGILREAMIFTESSIHTSRECLAIL